MRGACLRASGLGTPAPGHCVVWKRNHEKRPLQHRCFRAGKGESQDQRATEFSPAMQMTVVFSTDTAVAEKQPVEKINVSGDLSRAK